MKEVRQRVFEKISEFSSPRGNGNFSLEIHNKAYEHGYGNEPYFSSVWVETITMCRIEVKNKIHMI